MANEIENELRRLADAATGFLSVDREVCRRALCREPEERVREGVRWALGERNLTIAFDSEGMIKRWPAITARASTAEADDAVVWNA